MSLELLRFPSLCADYFKMVTFICEVYPEKICDLPENLFKNLLGSLEAGLSAFGSDITQYILDFLQTICTHMFNASLQQQRVYQAIQPFLKIILDLLLSTQVNSDLYPKVGTTLFALLCCYPENYQNLVQIFLNSQIEPETKEILISAFNDLTTGLKLQPDRQNRIKFRDNFEKFIIVLKGNMIIK